MFLEWLGNHPLGSRLSCARVVARVERRDRVARAALRFCAEAEARENEQTARQVAIVWLPLAEAKNYLVELWAANQEATPSPRVSVWDAMFSDEAANQEERP